MGQMQSITAPMETCIRTLPAMKKEGAEKYIQCGPFEEMVEFKQSLGEKLFKSLKSHPSELEILIEGDTDRRVTCAEFLKRSVSFAAGLKNFGVAQGDVVAVIGENCIEMNVVAVGTIFMGGILAPMDATFNSCEFMHLLKLLQPKIIVCHLEGIDVISEAMKNLGLKVPVITVGLDQVVETSGWKFEDFLIDVSIDEFNPATCTSPTEDIAMILFTSGTTGMPKGIKLSHNSLLYQNEIARTTYPLTTILHTSYFYWISGISMMIHTICYGATRVLLRQADPLQVLRTIDKYQVGLAYLSTSLFKSTINESSRSEFNLSSLKTIFVGGAPFSQTLVDAVTERIPGIVLAQRYGITELGGLVTFAYPPTDILSAGTPAGNIEIKIINMDSGESLPPGEEGEVLCRSPALMAGYVGDDELTRKFVDDEGWFRSGDFGKLTSDGVLYITGRIAELIKVGNHQFAPTEIENLISPMEGVLDVVVVSIPVEENHLPTALVVKNHHYDLREEEIIQTVRENLPEHKQLRGGVFFVDSVPRTTVGKMKRTAAVPIAMEFYRESKRANTRERCRK